MARVGKATIQTVSIVCPYCEGAWGPDRKGYGNVGADDVPNSLIVRCEECGKVFRLPAIVWRLGA
jgi:uncharacterized Zn finger protein